HAHARELAEGLAGILPGVADPAGVQTNIVFADVSATGHDAAAWADRLAAEGVLVTVVAGRVRMVTHNGVSGAGVAAAVGAWRRGRLEAPKVGERDRRHRDGQPRGEQDGDDTGPGDRLLASPGADDHSVGGVDNADPADPGGPGEARLGEPGVQGLGEQRVRAERGGREAVGAGAGDDRGDLAAGL